jgi:diaminohydroxyphosphoribosylaminopyrimidine deaminase/5-amino-6-(5-phosphoribosylamino)uracil reductase
VSGQGLDEQFMQRALDLAEHGACTTRPNPRVGCLIVDPQQQIIGEGWHQRAGGPHAEVIALRAAGERARGATAYVTLEPCAHFGRTPPCADALIAAGVAGVVIASGDPFAQVAGRGIERLRAAGITVRSAVLEAQARALNAGFFSRIERGRPWVRVKLACSLDGRSALADGRSQWITGAQARLDGHQWRARACAVLSGIGTLLADDPQLTSRPEPHCEQAAQLRLIVDSTLRTPPAARIFESPGVVILAHAGASEMVSKWPAQARLLSMSGANAQVDLAALLAWLATEQQINEVHVEAGARLAGALLDAGLVDELLIYQAPVVLGAAAMPMLSCIEPASLGQAVRLRLIDAQQLGTDLRIRLLRS